MSWPHTKQTRRICIAAPDAHQSNVALNGIDLFVAKLDCEVEPELGAAEDRRDEQIQEFQFQEEEDERTRQLWTKPEYWAQKQQISLVASAKVL